MKPLRLHPQRCKKSVQKPLKILSQNLVELVGIEPPQWVENIQLADSTMFSNG
jgi:hypothetical protein